MNNLKIGTRLGLAFGLVLLITAAIAAIGVWRLAELKEASMRLATMEMQRSKLAQEWKAAIDLNWVRASASLKTNDDGYVQALAADMTASSKRASESQKQLEALVADAEEKALMERVAVARSAYVGARAKLLERKKAGEDVFALVDSDLKPLANTYLQSLANVAENAQKKLSAFEKRNVEAAEFSQWTLAAGALISLVLGATLALWATRSIVGPVQRAVEAADEISHGNLAVDIRADGKDEMAQLLRSLAEMQRNLARIVGQVRSGSESVSTASSEIAQGNNDLSARTEQQASALQETAASMEQLNSTVRQNAENARQANQLAQSASTVAVSGGDVVSQVVSTMKDIHDSSSKIADIIGVIDGIAFQTNILALNAAVEAARAGEQGRGFAVVASEVRSLAGRSADAAKQIKTLINDSVERVGTGTALVDKAGATMSEVVVAIKRVTDLMGEISAASSEQSQGVAQVGEAVTQMDQVTQQNAALVEEMAAAASSLNNQAQDLVSTVAFFKVSAGQIAHVGNAPQPARMAMPAPMSYAPAAVAAPRVGQPAALGNGGASLGIDLDTAIQAHAQWRAKLRTAVNNRENLDADAIGRDDCCELGKWLHGAGSSQYGGKPSFVRLLDSHRQFHEEAGKVARLINQGAYDQADKELGNGTGFANASQKVSMAVVQLAKELKVRLAGSPAGASPLAARPAALKSPAKFTSTSRSSSAPGAAGASGKSSGKVTSAAGDDDWESF